MTLYEYNNMDIDDRYNYLFGNRGNNYVKINCIREDGDYKYSLWDCGDFFVEMCAINGKVIQVEGIEPGDERFNLYIDWVKEHGDDPKYDID